MFRGILHLMPIAQPIIEDLCVSSFTGQSVDDSSTVPDPCSPTCAEEIDSGQVSEVASLELYSDEATECTDNPLTNANALSSCSSIHIEADDSISMLVDKGSSGYIHW